MKTGSILRELCPQTCDPLELEQVLLRRYGSASGAADDPNAMLFPGDQKSYAVRLVFTKKHALKDALAGPALGDGELTDLVELTKRDLFSTEEPTICNWVMFAALPVSGCFRFRDDFQILPVPIDAPLPDFLMADHPFLVQFKFAGSGNPFVAAMRQFTRGREVEFLLSTLVGNQIRSDRNSETRWVVLPPVGNPPKIHSSVLCHVGYHYETLNSIQDSFTTTNGPPPLKTIPTIDYFAQVGIKAGQQLELPEHLESCLDAYKKLPQKVRECFLNSCYWFQHAQTVFRNSQSASFLALVQAVEAIMPPPEKGMNCQCCNRNMGKGPTGQFRDFLEGLLQTNGDISADLTEFYGVRSKFAHGGKPFVFDRQVFAGGLESFEDNQKRFSLHRLVQQALQIWLLAEAKKYESKPG